MVGDLKPQQHRLPDRGNDGRPLGSLTFERGVDSRSNLSGGLDPAIAQVIAMGQRGKGPSPGCRRRRAGRTTDGLPVGMRASGAPTRRVAWPPA
jgi:hypothetical protein